MTEADKQSAMGLECQRKKTSRNGSRARRSDLEQAKHLKAEATRKQQTRMTQADLFRASFLLEAMSSSVHFENFVKIIQNPQSCYIISTVGMASLSN
jgi:hypothetical protein